ncbi:MAG: hypothetical protein ACSLFB_04875 [Acidimicrobiales bacterium]
MTVVPAETFVQAWERAYKDSVTESTKHKATFLLDTVGPRIATAALGLADARQLKRWATESDTSPREQAVALRFDALYRVARSISDVYSPSVAARFLRSANPQLGDCAPLVILSTATTHEEITRVLAAGRAFLEG